jgi:hypothetical protein
MFSRKRQQITLVELQANALRVSHICDALYCTPPMFRKLVRLDLFDGPASIRVFGVEVYVVNGIVGDKEDTLLMLGQRLARRGKKALVLTEC